jgi:hypothetical protein
VNVGEFRRPSLVFRVTPCCAISGREPSPAHTRVLSVRKLEHGALWDQREFSTRCRRPEAGFAARQRPLRLSLGSRHHRGSVTFSE